MAIKYKAKKEKLAPVEKAAMLGAAGLTADVAVTAEGKFKIEKLGLSPDTDALYKVGDTLLVTAAIGTTPEKWIKTKKGWKLDFIQLYKDAKSVAVQKKVSAKKYKAVGKSTVTSKAGGTVTTEDVVKEILAINELANIGFSIGQTINLGNYNSCKIQVSLHLPCTPDSVGIEEAYKESKGWVEGKMTELVAEITATQS